MSFVLCLLDLSHSSAHAYAFKSTRSAIKLSLNSRHIQIPLCYVGQYLFATCMHYLLQRFPQPMISLQFGVILFFMVYRCDTLKIHWWLMSWTLAIDVYVTVACSVSVPPTILFNHTYFVNWINAILLRSKLRVFFPSILIDKPNSSYAINCSMYW